MIDLDALLAIAFLMPALTAFGIAITDRDDDGRLA